MGFENSLKHPSCHDNKRYDYRYHYSKQVDPACRNNGGDDWEASNRTIAYKKEEEKADYKHHEYYGS